MTADQALFDHAQLELKARHGWKSVLVTGAAGGVGMLIVQFAVHAGHSVVAATSSNARNLKFLRSLGTAGVTEYSAINASSEFDVVIDTVGGTECIGLSSSKRYITIVGDKTGRTISDDE